MVKDLVRRYNPGIIILQEIKLLIADREVVDNVCHFSNPGWIEVHSVGTARGILLIWDKMKVDYIEAWAEYYSASIVAACLGDLQRWMVMGVYGPSEGDNSGVLCWSLIGSELGGTYLGVSGGTLMRSSTWTKEIGLGEGLGEWRSSGIL